MRAGIIKCSETDKGLGKEKRSSIRVTPQIEFTPEAIRKAWAETPDSAGAICRRERDRGLLALRTSRQSAAIVAVLYSKVHGQSVQKSLRRFSRPAEITDAALSEVREQAEAFAKECDGIDGEGEEAEKQRRLKKHESLRLRDLVEVYYKSDHWLSLKNDNTRRDRKGLINGFLNYAPQDGRSKPLSFGARRIAQKSQRLKERDLEQFRRDTVARCNGKPFVYNRARSHVLKMLRVLAADSYFPPSNIPTMKKEAEKPDVACRSVTLSLPMIKTLWNATESLPIYQKNFVRLLILTGQRRSIISGLLESECLFEADPPQLLISGSRSKNGLNYMVPLTPLMIELINEVPRLEGNPHVFAVSDTTAMSGFNTLKYKLDAKMKEALGAKFTEWRFHDLRRVFVTRCNIAGVEPRVRELLLAHTPNWVSSTERNYNVDEFIPEKIAAMRAVEEQFMRLIYPERFEKAEDEKTALLKDLSALPLEKLQSIKALLA